MKRGLLVLGAAGMGAGLMYLLDPDRGKRRRAVARDQMFHSIKKTGRALGKASRDVGNHARGAAAQLRSRLGRAEPNDEVLAARVRAKLGRFVSHPSAITVETENGLVRLSGPILANEVDPLLRGLRSVYGAREIENRLESHEQAGNISDLQGGRVRQGEPFAFMKRNWSPSARLAAAAAAGSLIFFGLKRRGLFAKTAGNLGLGILTRALTNVETKRLIGINIGARNVNIQKAITIAAPRERVFDYWSHPENFPHFMSHVRDVKKVGEDRYHWTVEGPAGVAVGWDSVITRQVPNELVEWESVPGSAVEQCGIARFETNTDGSTRVDIKLSYNPPGGFIGHTLANLFRVDPKHGLDDDLMRMKSFIETGKTPHDAAQPESLARKAAAP
jgi:uncharacterized membrane protein